MSPDGTHRKAQVCVVGGGPSGMVVANILHGAGIDVCVVERSTKEGVYKRKRAGLIEYRTVRILEEHGLAGRLLQQGTPHGTCEFRFDGVSIVVDYADLYSGRTHWVYPQQELTLDLQDAFLDLGGDLRFGVQANSIRLDRPVVECTDMAGDPLLIECDAVAGCDGYHGISRQSVPEAAIRLHERDYDFGWLAILAEVRPSTRHIIYATHARGFAGHMLRTPTVSRFYLEVASADSVDDWPSDRVWSELQVRLALPGWELHEGPIFDKTIFPFHSYVAEPMQHGPLYLVGDAAHIITPCGAKGMNLAIQDAEELAVGLLARLRDGDKSRLEGYSAARLPRVWRAQEFSHWMVSALHRGAEPDQSFMRQLQKSRLRHLAMCRGFAEDFAENYVGLL